MTLFLQQLINGLMAGVLFTLIALAFSLNMGVLGVLNIAIAEFVMFGAFIGVGLFGWGLSLPLVLLGAMGVGAGLALVLERVGYRFLQRGVTRPDPVVTLLSTLGFGLILRNIAGNVWGTNPTFFPDEVLSDRVALGPVQVAEIQLMGVAASVVLVAALWYLVSRTPTGRGLRALAEDRETGLILGVRVRRVEVVTFVVAGVLAGGAGVLLGLNFGTITPEFGIQLGLFGIAAMVLGGVGNIWGTLVAGPILGVAAALGSAYLGADYVDILVFGLLIATLLVRPQGILGTQNLVAGRV